MTTVSNKTQRPLSVPLPGGKTLHLGPGKTGQIAAGAAQDARFKKLVEAGEIEIVDEDPRPTAGPAAGKRGRSFRPGYGSGGGGHRGGDR